MLLMMVRQYAQIGTNVFTQVSPGERLEILYHSVKCHCNQVKSQHIQHYCAATAVVSLYHDSPQGIL